MVAYAQATIDAANTFTATGTDTQNASGTEGFRCSGNFQLHIGTGLTGTLTLQRSPDNGVTWYDVATFTAATDPDQVVYCLPKNIYRIGCKAGEFTSGSAVCRLEY